MSVDPTYFKPVLDWVANYRDRFLAFEQQLPDLKLWQRLVPMRGEGTVPQRWGPSPTLNPKPSRPRFPKITPGYVPKVVELILAAAYLVPSGRNIDALVHTFKLYDILVADPGWENEPVKISFAAKFPLANGQHLWSLDKDIGVARILKAILFVQITRSPAPVIPRGF